jgi:hypothetical protein
MNMLNLVVTLVGETIFHLLVKFDLSVSLYIKS